MSDVTKAELIAEAEAAGVDTSGTKAELEARLEKATEVLPHKPDVQEPRSVEEIEKDYPKGEPYEPDVQEASESSE